MEPVTDPEPPPPTPFVGQNLRQLRRKRGLSLERLARTSNQRLRGIALSDVEPSPKSYAATMAASRRAPSTLPMNSTRWSSTSLSWLDAAKRTPTRTSLPHHYKNPGHSRSLMYLVMTYATPIG